MQITREDKVRQAVSLWKAVQTQAWRQDGGGAAGERAEPVFSFRAINFLVRQLTAHDASWDAYFLGLGVESLKVTYEELAADPDPVIRRVLAHVGAEVPADLRIDAPSSRCRRTPARRSGSGGCTSTSPRSRRRAPRRSDRVAAGAGRLTRPSRVCSTRPVDSGARETAPDPAPAAPAPAQMPPSLAPTGSPVERMRFVQRHAGNAAVARILGGQASPARGDRPPPAVAPAADEHTAAASGALRAAVLARRASGRLLQRAVRPEGKPGARSSMNVGDTGPGVKLLQRLLGVPESGTFDAATRTAADQFQRQQGWDPGGVGPMTWAALDDHAGAPGRRPNLDVGERGPGVKLLQSLLGVTESSSFGPATRKAVDRFQRQQGWSPSGVGPMTWAALEGHAGAPGRRPNLVADDRGPAVKLLQRALGVPQTSVFDAATRTAMDEFQRRQGWLPSGVGPMTWAALEHELNRLDVADRMGTMANPAAPLRAVWHWSNNRSDSTDFSHWARAASEDTTFSVGSNTVINCWEMVLWAAYKTGAVTWTWIHDTYTWSGPTSWFVELERRLIRGGATTFDRARQQPRPRRGDIVMFNGADHVALAKGEGTKTYSFWPAPDITFVGDLSRPGAGGGLAAGTPDRVKVVTIEDLAKACDEPGKPCVVTFGPPPW